ncbi:Mu transposase, C-terminal [Alkalispirochaeta americana]|uniref:Mu transposase, C-terminal n=1 Tax=Alkalispirochaeta americana TaxID=159291 RepID=A0A1N6UT64_9SPIO|nr:DDE-type integrase/transposase/recombinase [Alkalispirochaeta americana]SIQ68820.1 Mu transposase, C-terminal [Alkalispirochaeta americana]
MPKIRADQGISRVLSAEEQTAFLEELAQYPKLTAGAVYRKLLEERRISTRISSSSLSRIVVAAGMSRNERLQEAVREKSLKFEFFAPLECVQADCMHGPLVANDTGKREKAILLAFIDDATRRIVYSEFSFTERSMIFEQGLRHILSTHGRIGRVYVDNGATFISSQTKRILDSLQVLLVHSKPGRPQGRGKIERYFRTVRDSFLRPMDTDSLKSLADLNARFHTWLESEYHRNPHRGLNGKTPLEAWLEKAQHIRTIDPTVDLETIFFHEEYRKVHRDSTITIAGTLYEVPSILIGRKVKCRFDPHRSLRRIHITHDGKDFGECRIVNTYDNTRVTRSEVDPEVFEESSSVEHPNVLAGLSASRSFAGGGQ